MPFKVKATSEVDFSTTGVIYTNTAGGGIGGSTSSMYGKLPYKLFTTNSVHSNGYTYQNIDVPSSGNWDVIISLKYESCGWPVQGITTSPQKGGKAMYSGQSTMYSSPQNVTIQRISFKFLNSYECP